MSGRCALLSAALALGFGAGAGSAQVVTGRVVEHGTQARIPGAAVALLDSTGATIRGVLTNEDGTFLVLAPVPGVYGLAVTAFGYRDLRSEGLLIRDSERVVLELTMTADPLVLETVEVVARDRSLRQRYLREHWERMEEAEPHEIGRTVFPRLELARYHGLPLSGFMEAFAPLSAVARRRGAPRMPGSPAMASSGCAPAVFWNGWQRGPDEDMSIADIEGIEFYSGTGPSGTHFINPAGCGVVLIWSRVDVERPERNRLGLGIAIGIAGTVVWLMSLVVGG